MKHLLMPFCGALLLFLPAMGCSATGYAIEDLATEINATLDTAEVRVAVGDTLSVRFPFATHLNHDARVKKDGTAAFLIVGDVKVEGLTTKSLNEDLHGLYKAAKNEQIVSVAHVPGVDAATGQAVYVVGEVTTPGPIALTRRRLTLIEAIAEAGGLIKDTANPCNVLLVRRLVGSNEMKVWRLDAHPYYWGRVPPIFLQPTDIVIVPNTAVDGVNIWVDKYIRQMLPFPYLTGV